MSQETIRAAERAAGQVKTMSTYDPDSDQLHEECGIFGVWAPDRDVARLTYFGLRALHHRGQEIPLSAAYRNARLDVMLVKQRHQLAAEGEVFVVDQQRVLAEQFRLHRLPL